MPETTADTDASTDTAAGATTTTETTDALGDAGKRALEEERAARRDAERARKTLEKELETLRQQSMSDGEKAVARAKAEGRTEALATANGRLLRAEVKALAAGKLADPADAVHFLNLDGLTVDDDGEVDAKAITKAIDQLLKDKPYLAAGSQRVQGSGDGGARGPATAHADMNALLRRAAGRA